MAKVQVPSRYSISWVTSNDCSGPRVPAGVDLEVEVDVHAGGDLLGGDHRVGAVDARQLPAVGGAVEAVPGGQEQVVADQRPGAPAHAGDVAGVGVDGSQVVVPLQLADRRCWRRRMPSWSPRGCRRTARRLQGRRWRRTGSRDGHVHVLRQLAGLHPLQRLLDLPRESGNRPWSSSWDTRSLHMVGPPRLGSDGSCGSCAGSTISSKWRASPRRRDVGHGA